MSVPPPPPPPPPPDLPEEENLQAQSGTDPFGTPADGFDDDEQGLESGVPEVAASKSRVMVVGLAFSSVVLFLLYNLFFSSEKVQPVETKKVSIVKETKNREAFTPPPSLPATPLEPEFNPPPPAPIAAPPPILPPSRAGNIVPPPNFNTPAIPAPDPLPIVDPEAENAARAQLQARQRSGIFAGGGNSGGSNLFGGNGGTPTSQGGDTGLNFGSGPNGQFASAATQSQSARAVATRLGNLRQIIGQGRIIQATMESAINTDLPTQVRAVVARDVYAEAGRAALIPKGSRLIGVYNTSLVPGQSRVFIIWQRIIRPDGVDIRINSTGVDNLGVAGLPGFVDSKFQQIFSRAVLASVISIALATGAEAINNNDENDSTSTSTSPLTGGTTVTQSGTSGAINGAIDTISSVTQGFLSRFVNINPTVIVDQGTPINVMLNRDLYFPGNVAGAQIIE